MIAKEPEPGFDASRVMQNPGHTVIPEGVDLTQIRVDGHLVPVRKVYVLNEGEAAAVDPNKYDAVVRLGDSIRQ